MYTAYNTKILYTGRHHVLVVTVQCVQCVLVMQDNTDVAVTLMMATSETIYFPVHNTHLEEGLAFWTLTQESLRVGSVLDVL